MNKARMIWNGIKKRCSKTEATIKKIPTYIECTVCDEWRSFDVFELWFNDNYIEGNEIDKDLLKKGNKVYCPEYCCFVPSKLNLIIGKKENIKRSSPMGVCFCKKTRSYIAQINIDSLSVNLGSFVSAELAAMAYKMAKELEVKRVAKYFFIKRKINASVYFSLLSWEHNEEGFSKMSIPEYFLLRSKEKKIRKKVDAYKRPDTYKSKYSLDYKKSIINEFNESGMRTIEFERLKGLPLSTLSVFKAFITKQVKANETNISTTRKSL